MNKFKTAAIEILQKEKVPLHYKDITQKALDEGLLETDGATPEASMNAQLSVDIKNKGEASDFIRVSPGIFNLNPDRKEPEKKNSKKNFMDALEEYYSRLDNSNYDVNDIHTIEAEIKETANILLDQGKNNLVSIAELERQAFSINKSFDTQENQDEGKIRGLSWQLSGSQTLEGGSVQPIYWPDVLKLTQKEFEYFESRYNSSKNLFAKTEFGLLVYFGERTPFSKHNNFKQQLCNELIQLSKSYLEKAKLIGEKNYNATNFFHSIRLAFRIAEKARIEPELSNIVDLIFIEHQNWDVTREGTLRILLDLSGLMADYFNLFKNSIDFAKVIEKNLIGAQELEKSYVWGAIYSVDRNIAIQQKRNEKADDLLLYKAQLYEKLAMNAEKNNNLACISFIEDALRIYQQLKDGVNISKLESLYSDLRGKFNLTEIHQELPDEYSARIRQSINDTLQTCNSKEILYHLITTPWYEKLENIRMQAEESAKQSVLLSILPSSVLDKFGNTVDVFYSEEEKKEYNFWSTYSFMFQIGTQTMHLFFLEAFKAGKLNFNSVIEFLENTWLNDVINRKYHGKEVEIIPLDTIKPGIKRLFEEIDHYFQDNSYACDFVTVIDSLTLKIESILRNFCEKIGIATFKTRQKGGDKLIMEKLLDDILADIAHQPSFRPEQFTNFDEEDRMLIKYILTEKTGLNLRNQIAHGLMDINDYSFKYCIIVLCIILKLSKYKFVEKN